MAKKAAAQQTANPDAEPPAFQPSNAAFAKRERLVNDLLRNMIAKSGRNQFAGIMLGGDPGVGKTTFINFFSKLLGIELIVVEAPHIVEEHIINIPFLVFDPNTGAKSGGQTSLTQEKQGNEYKVVLADSNLFTKIASARKLPDEEYIRKIYSSTKDIIAIYEAFGGTQKSIPRKFAAARQTFSVLLFIDEYFRQSSVRIQNILRGILNGKIGSHDIPHNVYIVYASNLDDEGLMQDIPLNMQFDLVHMHKPTKDEWFSWLVYKFEQDEHVHLNMTVINKFHHILEDEDMSSQATAADIRVSPRRWEQLILYVNQSLPAKNEKDAQNLMSNVKLNFRDYKTGEHHEIAEKVLDAVAKLIKQTSGIDVTSSSINEASDWRSTLEHQIETKKKTGEHRKYVPVIAGLPGIGKTAQVAAVARKEGMILVDINVADLNPDDVVGLPIPKNQENGSIQTTFSVPGLYHRIINQIKAGESRLKQELSKTDPENAKEKFAEFQSSRWKYLVFFDELNRAKPKVFNAIRRVLLEKNFGPAEEGGGKLLELPKESIMLGAINPEDTGAEDFTSHVKDVLDVIGGAPSWIATKEYLSEHENFGELGNIGDVTPKIKETALDILSKFVGKFKSGDVKIPLNERPFHLDMGTDVYISPREYTQMYVNLVHSIVDEVEDLKEKDLDSAKPDELHEMEMKVRAAIFHAFEITLNNIFYKHKVEADEFKSDLQEWFMHSPEIDIGEDVFYKKGENIQKNLGVTLDDYLEGTAGGDASEEQDLINFLNNTDMVKFKESLTEMIERKIQKDEDVQKYILDTNEPKKVLKGKKITTDKSEKVSKLVNFMLELVYALHLNEISNDKIEAIWVGVNAHLKRFFKEKIQDPDLKMEAISASVENTSIITDEIEKLK